MKDYIRQVAIKTKRRDTKMIEDAINTAYVFLTFGNDIASGAMVDARDSIKSCGYYKKECKQYLNNAFREYDHFEMGLKDLYRDWETDRKSTRLNSSHSAKSRMPSSA